MAATDEPSAGYGPHDDLVVVLDDLSRADLSVLDMQCLHQLLQCPDFGKIALKPACMRAGRRVGVLQAGRRVLLT